MKPKLDIQNGGRESLKSLEVGASATHSFKSSWVTNAVILDFYNAGSLNLIIGLCLKTLDILEWQISIGFNFKSPLTRAV